MMPVKPLPDNDSGAEEEKGYEPSRNELLEKKKAESLSYERKMLTARELGHLEEKYYRDQLNSCLHESYQPNVLEQGNQLDTFVESSIEVLNGGATWQNDNQRQGESQYVEQSLVNALSQSPQRPQVNNQRNEFSTPAS